MTASMAASGSASGRSVSERSMSDSEDDMLSLSSSHTSYCISTMQIPRAEAYSVAVSGILAICINKNKLAT